MARLRPLGVCVVVLVAAATVGAVLTASAASDYSLSASPAVDVPERTVEFEGDSYTVSAIARVPSGTDLAVTATAPSGTDYTVHLYNSDRQIVDSTRATGEATVTFETGYLDPGSYTVVLERDGVFETVHPVVVPAYDATVETPSAVTAGDHVDVSTTVSQVESGTEVETIEIVVANAETSTRVDVGDTAPGTYDVSVATADLPTGDYLVYADVRGPDTVDGRHELIGLSDSHALAIEPESTPTPTATATPSTGDGTDGGSTDGGDAGGTGGDSEATPPPTTVAPTPTATPQTPTPTPTPTVPSPTRTPPTPTPSTPSPASTVSTPTPTPADVLQPNLTTASPGSPSRDSPATTAAEGPGFGVVTTLLALLAGVAVGARTRRG